MINLKNPVQLLSLVVGLLALFAMGLAAIACGIAFGEAVGYAVAALLAALAALMVLALLRILYRQEGGGRDGR